MFSYFWCSLSDTENNSSHCHSPVLFYKPVTSFDLNSWFCKKKKRLRLTSLGYHINGVNIPQLLSSGKSVHMGVSDFVRLCAVHGMEENQFIMSQCQSRLLSNDLEVWDVLLSSPTLSSGIHCFMNMFFPLLWYHRTSLDVYFRL